MQTCIKKDAWQLENISMNHAGGTVKGFRRA
jgi:hypothetical protein